MKIEIEVTKEMYEFLKAQENRGGAIEIIDVEPVPGLPRIAASEGEFEPWNFGGHGLAAMAAFYLTQYVDILEHLKEEDAVGFFDCFTGEFVSAE